MVNTRGNQSVILRDWIFLTSSNFGVFHFISMPLAQRFHGPSPCSWKEGIIENLPSHRNPLTCLVPATPG
jgi:hypothetical protein